MELSLFALSAVFLLIAMHPFVTYPLSLRLFRDLKPRPSTACDRAEHETTSRHPRFSICMSAYNEEAVIEQKIRNLLALREHTPDLEILIYVDLSEDRTAEICRRFGNRISLHEAGRRTGKTYGMNLLVSRSHGDILVFTDANVMLDADVVVNLERHFRDPEVGCVCGSLRYTNAGDSVTAANGSLYWRLEEHIKRLEGQTGSVMGADGSLFAIRRQLHHAPPDHIIDDMYVSFMVLCEGYRIVQADDVRAYERSATQMKEEFQRKVRIACQAFNVHRLLWPRLRKLDAFTLYEYISHKLLRWFSIYFLMLSGLCFELALMAADVPVVTIATIILGSAALYCGYRWSIKPFSSIVDLLAALAGAGIGVVQSLRGRAFRVWSPADSIRGK
jgi:cellulose synthase/poly-beta-1,6-N-acetylglucosamine synthase-like glycosyltransferase